MDKLKIIGIELMTLQLILTVGLFVFLGDSGLMPIGMYTLVFLLSVIMLLVVGFLIFGKKKTIYRIISIILSLLVSAGFILSFYLMYPAVNMLHTISSDYDELANVSAYVREDDFAQTLEDAKDYNFGILSVLDRENTDDAVEKMEEKLCKTLLIREYDSITMLADALESGEIDVIVLNQSLLMVLDELEGYEEFRNSIREISNEEVVIKTILEEDTDKKTENYVYTFYISGIDGWGGIDTTGRSDVNIIATVNTQTKQILLVSTPRDYFVELPVSNGMKDKLTHAGIYGIDCSIGTLEQLYDIDIDYYFRINFSGFETIIDAIGGIDVYSEYDFTVADWHYQVGMNHLDGLSALAFARERYTLPGGDLARGENQMRIIQATLDKCMSPAILNNYAEILEGMEGSFQTDLPYDMMASLIRMQMRDGSDWNIQTFSVSGTGRSSGTYSIPNMSLYVMEPDMATVEYAQELMQSVRDGEVINITE